ncbi:MAG: alpha-hydroxy-acid oxidizing protein [Gammaproteobacteria bacterium]|nr:alpha-hydroxy-acid oxidizing protein [Gammaproteobacteria bacterium]
MSPELLREFPAIADLARRARSRIPHFAWEFLDSGTGTDRSAERNCTALAEVQLMPLFMRGELRPDTRTRLFGVDYAVPFGVSPVGMSGIIWPGCEAMLARTAGRRRFPYTLSTAASATPERIGPLGDGMAWYQLYPPRSANMRRDLLVRARAVGFTTLLLTVDVPAISRRERQMRAGVSSDARLNPRMLLQCLWRPSWSLATWQHGKPAMQALERYVPASDTREFLQFVGEELNGTLDWDYVKAVRDEWDGPLVIKGILDPGQARQAVAHGVDAVMVSNHGGRQLDAAPAAIAALPAVARAVGGQVPILFDSGVRSGLDIARAIALGADFVLLGRAFMYGVAALDARGPDHVADVLSADLVNVMSQLGCATLTELRERVI